MMRRPTPFVNNDGVAIKSDDLGHENELVARNVKRFRLERAMSLGELSRRSGLSKQTLSKIEQGSGNPTVETLAQLGAALGMPARRLLNEWGTPVYVQRRGEGEWDEDQHWRQRLLDETYGSGYVRTLVLRMERDHSTPKTVEPHAPGTLHHLYLITGKVRTGPLDEPVDLSAGDFVRFPGDVPHQVVCLSEAATAHMVTTLPQVRRIPPTVTRGGPPEQ
ncbi:helix-turn-helix domain-containing protein [Streptomyces gilvus]|uniref:helix-turn-helix domain-containing protein n=1 Tax=Streptomyces gilvus TaxID=2920937 RepID=UPI001F0E46F7|nr:XRE family transcriptional regulator [Streptomyces sp. CME 23]MCH5672884.1 XRE family transcriptional regulator [Streptomyces sp. CME 23]